MAGFHHPAQLVPLLRLLKSYPDHGQSPVLIEKIRKAVVDPEAFSAQAIPLATSVEDVVAGVEPQQRGAFATALRDWLLRNLKIPACPEPRYYDASNKPLPTGMERLVNTFNKQLPPRLADPAIPVSPISKEEWESTAKAPASGKSGRFFRQSESSRMWRFSL